MQAKTRMLQLGCRDTEKISTDIAIEKNTGNIDVFLLWKIRMKLEFLFAEKQ